MKEKVLNFLASLLPEGIDPCGFFFFLVSLILIMGALCIIARCIGGKECGYNHAIASALAIIFVYTVMMWLHGGIMKEPIDTALNFLPLIEYDGETVTLFDFRNADLWAMCEQILFTYTLSLILIWLDDMIHDARNGIAWFLLQLGITVVALSVYCVGAWMLNRLIPDGLHFIVPFVAVVIFAFVIALIFLGFMQRMLLKVVNPMLSEINNFVFGHQVGKTLGKALFCTLALCIISSLLISNGIVAFVLADMTFLICIVPLVAIACLWVLVGHILFNSPN